MPWYKISVDDVSGALQSQVQEEFKTIFIASGGPKDVALFATPLDDTGSEMFFSPQASQLARSLINKYAGKECERPSPAEVALLIGHGDACDHLL